MRSAGCLPELRVISAFGGQPAGLTFLSVPPCTPSDHRKKCVASPACAVVGASVPLDRGTVPAQAHLGVSGGLSAYTSYPFGLPKEKRERPMRWQAPTRAVVCVSIPGLWIFIIRTNSPILLTAEVQKISGIYPAIAFALNKAIEFCYKIGQMVLIRGKSRNSPLFFHHNQCKTAPALA